MTPRRKAPRQTPDAIRLMVVEPRSLLVHVLDQVDELEVVAKPRSVTEAIPILADSAPDVILVNLPHELSAATDIARELRRETPYVPLIVLGGGDDDASIVEALEVGATAHVAERAEPAELVATIRRVAKGEDPLKDEIGGRPDLVERIIDLIRQSMFAGERPVNPLTPRQLEILRLVAGGKRNQEIAVELGISTQTVKNHMTAVMHKLGVPNRIRAVTYAVRQGWLAIDETPVNEVGPFRNG